MSILKNTIKATVALIPVFFALGAGHVRAESLDRKLYFGLGTGLYLPADRQGGGFRYTSGGEREVSYSRGVYFQGVVGYGIPLPPPKEGGRRRMGMAVELDVRYLDHSIGDDSIFLDPDASSIQAIPVDTPLYNLTPGRTYDEETIRQKIGDLTMMPVLANVVFRFGVQKKTTAYVGGGVGWVFMDFKRSSTYRDYVGYDDAGIDDSIAFNVKGGIDVQLNKRLIFNVIGDYLIISEHFTWNGVNSAFGTQDFDIQTSPTQPGYGIPDVYGRPADYRLSDPGNFRLDGLSLGVGFRWVLGKGEKKAAETPAE